LNQYNIYIDVAESVDNDAITATLATYAFDAYAISMEHTWLASEVANNDYVGWCFQAATFGASCW